MDPQTIEQLVERHGGDRSDLISLLEIIQNKYSFLPPAALRIVAEKTGQSLVDVYGVATFYKSFSLEPRGRHLVSVCLGTACHVRAAPTIAAEFEKRLEIRPGETTPDREFTLETVNCLGACALGPIVVVDGHYFAGVAVADVRGILDKTVEGLDKVEIKTDERIFPVEVSCPRCNRSLMDPYVLVDNHPSIRIVAAFGRKHGSLRLSCLYGSYNILMDHEVPMDQVVNFFCPHCHGELTSAADCPGCSAPMVPMIVRGGGIVEICSRRGCKEHKLDLDGVNL
ncbi:MAG: NAD(P)H-dependent oxidoreductase subunit E [Deltaproteobacteria bacterium]|nr:NAD(P)H-dependent oxidoreductase subunit E [Deltaproteobacteria bacterium]